MSRASVNIVVRVWRTIVATVLRSMQNVITALVQINANKGRALLTTLGIIIAVTSTITVVAVVQGFGNYMTKMVRGYGTQFMVVRPYYVPERYRQGMPRVKLEMSDYHAVREECPSIARMTPFVFTHNGEITYGVEKAEDIPIRGVDAPYQVIRNFHVDAGRFFGPMDVETAAHVIVLGRTVLKFLQCDESIVGDYVYLDGMRFLVIGLLETKGSMMGEDQDKTAMIPYTMALKLYPENRESVYFLAEAADEGRIDQAAGEITKVLRRRHRLEPGQPDDFSLDRQDQALGAFEKVRNVASGVLGGIVGISLLVGGIGIMNMMLVSVSERTREIGLRKSVGARRRDIMLQFLTEAVVLCTVGGLIGVGIGYAITDIASRHPRIVDVSVPMWSVLLALGFSAATGVIFGIVPAFKAALLNPIDALRYE
jgi:putative ABC transport system permease protein